MVSPLNWKIDGGMLQVLSNSKLKKTAESLLSWNLGWTLIRITHTTTCADEMEWTFGIHSGPFVYLTMHSHPSLGWCWCFSNRECYLTMNFTIGYATHESECGNPNFPTCRCFPLYQWYMPTLFQTVNLGAYIYVSPKKGLLLSLSSRGNGLSALGILCNYQRLGVSFPRV